MASEVQRNASCLSTKEWNISATFFENSYLNSTRHKIEYLEPFDIDYYEQKVLSSQYQQLLPLQEDLAEWINETIGVNYITGENFFNVLDNGVIVCHLARVIENRAKEVINKNQKDFHVPIINSRCWEMAARGSFFARDNMENFIKFCRQLGVHENLLFESDDLVLQNQPRNVILCLLEVARLATKYSLKPPTLVQFEKELDAEENVDNETINDSGLSSLTSWQFKFESPNLQITNSMISLESDDNLSKVSSDQILLNSLSNKSELDIKIQNTKKVIERNCNCSGINKCMKLKIRKISDGKYNICGKTVFIRLLKGQHMMVRVGGGWDTLEHFLIRHYPCQIKVMTRYNNKNLTNLRLNADSNTMKFLHIHSKYKSINKHDSH